MTTRVMQATTFPHFIPAKAPARAAARGGHATALMGCNILVVGSALAAYNLGPIPIQWLTQFGWIALFLYVGLRRGFCTVPGARLLIALAAWSLLVTVANTWCYDYESLQPELATTPYPLFIALRFLRFLSFGATLQVVFWLLRAGHGKEVVKLLTIAGSVASLAALYIYVAQVYGLPELPRNRMGTSGAEQITQFTYAFHRAMGTFREPSHLAEWLVVPFFMSLLHRPRALNAHAFLIGSALLLTGSLTGIMGVALGLAGALFFCGPMTRSSLKIGFHIGMIVVLGLIVFSCIAVSNTEAGPNLLQVVGDRLSPILSGNGIRSTNRNYVYEYIDKHSIPLLGYGLGNADLLFAQYRDTEFLSGYLSLYINFLFSTGVPGLALVGLFVALPLWRLLVMRSGRRSYRRTLIFAGYLAYVIMFAVHSEEFTTMFAIVFALLVHETLGKRPANVVSGAAPLRVEGRLQEDVKKQLLVFRPGGARGR